MSIIKQLATYDGSAWTKDDIGANAGNVSFVTPAGASTTIAGSNNVQGALSNLCGASKLTGSSAIVTNSSGTLTASSVTSTELDYLSGVTSNLQGQIDTLNNNLLQKVYPVGAIYMSVSSTSPATLFGGTWQRIQDKFLLSAGSTYEAGGTGGAATVSLAVGNLPSHNHTYNKSNANTNATTLTVDQIPAHQHKVVKWNKNTTTFSANVGWYASNASSGSGYWSMLTGSDGSQTHDCGTNATGGSKSHAHGIGTTSTNTGNTGSGTAHNNMPPYLTVYVWKRTA